MDPVNRGVTTNIPQLFFRTVLMSNQKKLSVNDGV